MLSPQHSEVDRKSADYKLTFNEPFVWHSHLQHSYGKMQLKFILTTFISSIYLQIQLNRAFSIENLRK